jgi:hypothetical protein
MDATKVVLKKVDRDIYGCLQMRQIEYDVKEIANIRFGTFKDFHSDDDIKGNNMNPDDKCIYITFREVDANMNSDRATFSGDWEIEFKW